MDATPHSITYYVYALARPDGRVFYIGKGSNTRIFAHEVEARSGHRCHKCNLIRKIWRSGGEIQRYILLTTGNEQEAFDYEVASIALYGLENLTNQNAGGKGGMRGAILAVRHKISKGLRRRWASAESRQAQSKRMRGARTEDGHRRVRQAQVAYWQNAEHRQKRIENIKRTTQTIESRVRNSEIQQQRYGNPLEREKTAAASRKRFQNLEERERARQQAVERWGYSYTLFAPDGMIHTTDNLNAFCQEYNLNASHMRGVCTGRLKAHKGWTGTRAQSIS